MSDSKPVRAIIWREAISALRRNIKLLWLWAVGFSVLMVIAYFFHFREQLPIMLAQIHDLKKAAHPPVPAMPRSLISILAQLCANVIYFVSVYCLYIVYLRQEPITIRPDFSVNSFFYWVGKTILKILAIFGTILVSIVVVTISGIILTMIIPPAKGLVMFCGLLLVCCMAVYTGGKYFLVGPLALSRMKPVLKSSWSLIKGNWWRLIGQFLIFFLMIWFLLLLCFLVYVVIVLGLLGADFGSWISVLMLSLIIGANMIVATPAMIVFLCTATRILYEEKRAADPNFMLTQPT